MASLYDLTHNTIDELLERLKKKDEGDYVGDIIYEVADDCVPVHWLRLMKIASYDLRLADKEPEIWPAFDGRPTAINIIAANIYEHLVEEMREAVQENEELMND